MVKQCLYMMNFKQLYQVTKEKWLFLPGNCARFVSCVDTSIYCSYYLPKSASVFAGVCT